MGIARTVPRSRARRVLTVAGEPSAMRGVSLGVAIAGGINRHLPLWEAWKGNGLLRSVPSAMLEC